MPKRLVSLILFFFWTGISHSFSQNTEKIEILHANSLEYDETIAGKTKRLIGDVQLLHDGALMYCDSAWLASETNTVQAFNKIHIKQGDTLDLYGDKLDYDGNTKKAVVTGRVVKLIDKDVTLTTTVIYYDRNSGIANYLNGGKIVDKKSILTSETGFYHSKDKNMFYRKNVKVVNKDYTILCDTLRFNTETEISYFLGPTNIVAKDSSKIYCESGWNDSRHNKSQFSIKAKITSDKQIMSGDTIFYDEKIEKGTAWCNVSIIDTTNKLIIYGDYAEYFKLKDESFVTKNALMVQIEKQDTLYLHADTLRSIKPDTTIDKRLIRAYYHTRFFKTDLQGSCDSLSFNQTDSLMRMFGRPIMWSEGNQITGDTILVQLSDGEVSDFFLRINSFIISRHDSLNFNQIKGRYMHGFLIKNKLSKVRVEGNSQTLYFAEENNGDKIGINKAESSDMLIYVNENKINRITFLKQPTAVMNPMKAVGSTERKLSDFIWLDDIRPKNKDDIFDWKEVKQNKGGRNSGRKR